MKIKNMNLEIIELEIEKIVQLFAKGKNLKIKIFFGTLGDKNFPKETNDHPKTKRGFCNSNKTLGRYEIYIRLDRSSRALIFQTLAHELAHVQKRDLEKENYAVKHDALFWKIMDEETFPFVRDNLQSEKD